MVVHNQPHKPLQQVVALLFRQAVDALRVVAHGEDALPARHRVGAHHRVHGRQLVADVLGRAPGCRVQLELVLLGALVEGWLREGGGQPFEEFLVGLGDAVVDFVAGGPEGICMR